MSFLARRHPVNVLRRQQILDKLIADYEPQTMMQRFTCEHLAGNLEQLEVLKPGSQEHRALVPLSQTLFEALEASRPKGPTVDHGLSLDEMSEKVKRIDAMIELVRRSQQPVSAEASSPDPEPNAAHAVVTPVSEPEPEARAEVCPYCMRACVGRDHPAWEVLHGLDPEVVKKRDAEATREMMARVLRPHPWWDGQ